MPAYKAYPATEPARSSRLLYYRHRLPVRIMHWINVLCLPILLLSGLGIFNAHPSLYWGQSSYSSRPAVLEISARAPAAAATSRAVNGAGETKGGDGADGADNADDVAPDDEEGAPRGILRIGSHTFDTTGVLGVSSRGDGTPNEQAFPSWLTIPGHYSLAESRSWHFFFAWLFVLNGLAYVVYTLASGHLRRDLLPDATEVRGIGPSIVDHLKFKHPHGEAAKRYNVLQKLAYLAVIFVLLPLVVLMGMAMSPALDAVFSGWVDWFGGRQSARTIHFIVAWLLVAFVLVHVFEVIVSGLWNHMRSMITGYYRIDAGNGKGDKQ